MGTLCWSMEQRSPLEMATCGHHTTLFDLLPFWGQRAPAFRQGGEWPSPLPLLEHPCSTAGRRTGADPVWGGLRASALCTPCRVCAAVPSATRQRVQQAPATPGSRKLCIHPTANSVLPSPRTSLGVL